MRVPRWVLIDINLHLENIQGSTPPLNSWQLQSMASGVWRTSRSARRAGTDRLAARCRYKALIAQCWGGVVLFWTGNESEILNLMCIHKSESALLVECVRESHCACSQNML